MSCPSGVDVRRETDSGISGVAHPDDDELVLASMTLVPIRGKGISMNGDYLRSVGSAAILLGGLLGANALSCSTNDQTPLAPMAASGASSGSKGDAGGGSGSSGAGGSGSSGAALDAHTMALLGRATGKTKPITDTHVHLYQPSRSGVAWPPSANTTLYKDYLPQAYVDMAATITSSTILGSGIVEASPWIDDTQWVLGEVAKITNKAFFPWYVAQLDIGSADFITNLTSYLKVDAMTNPDADKIVGLRVYLWSGSIDPTNAIQNANLKEVQRLGLTLDVISRGTPPMELNPKAQVVALAKAFPGIRIIIDHMAGAKIPAAMPPATWMADIASLAAQPNIFIKWSAFFDAANATGDESKMWTAPKDMASYQGIFDALFTAFGEDRLIWGSNYPVALLAGTVQEELTIAEAYLATKTTTNPNARDKIMFKNAIMFYRRVPGWTPPSVDAGAPMLDAKTTALLALATGKTKPVMDSHQHIYMPSRSGVAWPDPMNATLYHDYVPKTCMALSMKATCGPAYADEIAPSGTPLGILATNVVEASPRNNDATGSYDTDWVLSQIKGNDQFFNYAAQLDISSKDFIKNLDLNAEGMTADMIDRHAMVSGLRVYLWSAAIDPTDPTQAANLAEVQKRGMTLDIISRGTPPNEKNPKAQVVALAKAFPRIRIIIDHMAGAKIATAMPPMAWMADIDSLAAQPNIYVKMSAFFDAANATGDESMPWMAPKTMDMYKPIFDYLFTKFGEDRLIWGSNWPVVRLAGSIAEEVKIAEDYLATKTTAQRDKVMFSNAILFYRRVP
jgi:L-fuconolactonase